jgi:DNA-binding GntR family transcriptional regulator
MPQDNHGRDHFERAYGYVRERLDAGVYKAGERINILALRDELKLSQTPIREALSRLVGQNVIRDRRGEGYYVAAVEPRSAAQLYALYRLHLDAGLKEIRCHAEKLGRTLLSGQADDDPASRAARLFDNLLRITRNRPLSEAARQIDMRLRPLRRHEAALFADLEEECATLERLARAGDRASLRPAIRIFHQRRERSAAQLVSLVTGNGAHEI